MDNALIAAHFRQLADLMELHGENAFKIRSYANAGRNLKSIETPLSALDEEQLKELPGVGAAIAEKIRTLVTTGHLPLLDKYLAMTPPGVVQLLQIKGIGPGKVAQLWKELHIESLGELYYACIENRLTLLKGFGEKTQEKIKLTIEFLLQNSGRQLFASVERKWEDEFRSALQVWLGPEAQIHVTGEYRSQEITLNRLHLLLTHITEPELLARLNPVLPVETTPEGYIVRPDGFLEILMEITETSRLPVRLFETTGAQEHRDFVVSRLPGGTTIPDNCAAEEAIYQAAGLPLFPAEWRHAHTTFFPEPATQLAGLIIPADIKGVVHNHTVYSDGSNAIETLARHCQSLGYEYLVVSDHSKSAFYANGLSPERIFIQQQEIELVNSKLDGFRIFKSIECDILNDGQLDYEEEILKTFDLVIASVHSQLNMSEEKAMQRLIRAIENPYTNILGHLTGRLLLSRPGYPVDHQKIIDACKANGVVIELNANPHRLDIDWTWIRYCMEKEVLISIDPDAHNLKGVSDIQYGVYAARKAGLQKNQCINTLNADEFIKKIKSLKG